MAVFTAIAATAAMISAGLSYWATKEATLAERLDNSPALYLDCKPEPRRMTPWGAIFFPLIDTRDYLGGVNEMVQDELVCRLTNISRRPLVNVHIGFLAYFFAGNGHPEVTWPPSGEVDIEPIYLPDDATYKRYAGRTEALNLAPGGAVSFYITNGAPRQMQLVPAERAAAQYPGDDTPLCAPVYTSPGTLWTMHTAPMPTISPHMSVQSAPAYPGFDSGGCIVLDPLVNPQQDIGPAVAPPVMVTGKTTRRNGAVWIELPHY